MFEQKYGINPKRFLFWFGIYLGSIIFAYIKLFHDAPLAFWMILIIENVLTLVMGLDELIEEAMNEVSKGLELWIFVGGTMIGTIMLIALFFYDFKLAILLAVTEFISIAIKKLKSNQNT